MNNSKPTMEKKGYKLIKSFDINDSFMLGIYEGKLSAFDILIMYRQKIKVGERKDKWKWSRIRTPKHVHWAVDILLKFREDKEKTIEFLDYMAELWCKTKPLNSQDERQDLNINFTDEEIEKYKALNEKGEYSPKFLFALAKLLMIQEKTNNNEAFMFNKLIEKLKQGEDIFSIISAASFGGRKK
ncbi:MAG: hypothetical protein KA120_00505 [Candidatus Goldbacteria bacterium]|nr:hypothetical protein [Candidatus Goldiibacteriota bacterium]